MVQRRRPNRCNGPCDLQSFIKYLTLLYEMTLTTFRNIFSIFVCTLPAYRSIESWESIFYSFYYLLWTLALQRPPLCHLSVTTIWFVFILFTRRKRQDMDMRIECHYGCLWDVVRNVSVFGRLRLHKLYIRSHITGIVILVILAALRARHIDSNRQTKKEKMNSLSHHTR